MLVSLSSICLYSYTSTLLTVKKIFVSIVDAGREPESEYAIYEKIFW